MNGSCRPIIAPSVVSESCVTAPSVVTGAPNAPKATGAVLKIKVKTNASSTGNPSAISKALVIATGVPNPATPSSRQPKQNPTTTSTTRRSFGRCSSIHWRKSWKRPETTVTLYRTSALNTIHMTGTSANVAPANTLLKALRAGRSQTWIARTSPRASPADDACHAGRRNTPSRTSTVANGSAATRHDQTRLPSTGVTSC
jgi:hypothetical protein